MALESIKRNQEVCAGLVQYKGQIISLKGSLNQIATDIAALKAEITANTDGFYVAGDITYIESRITEFKIAIDALNTTVQAL